MTKLKVEQLGTFPNALEIDRVRLMLAVVLGSQESSSRKLNSGRTVLGSKIFEILFEVYNLHEDPHTIVKNALEIEKEKSLQPELSDEDLIVAPDDLHERTMRRFR